MNIHHRANYPTLYNQTDICPACGSKTFPDYIDEEDKQHCKCGYWRRIVKKK